MFTNEEAMSLENLGDGAAIEMFNDELQKILDNIVDPNAQAKKDRKIVLTVTIKPDEDRQIGDILIECQGKTAASRAYATRCVIGKAGKRGEARELKTNQTSFLNREGKVISIDKNEGKEEVKQ